MMVLESSENMRMRNPKYKDEVINNCDFLITDNIEFDNNNELLYIEIGMGKGDFILRNALNNPNINYIGIEKYSSVAAVAIKKIMDYKLDNLKVIISDVSKLEDLLKNKVDRIYLNFSDPWPKDRHAKRRLTHKNFLCMYDNFFKGNNEIIMKTDNDNLFLFSLDSLKEYGYTLEEVEYDLHSTDKDNIETEYETKFSNMGYTIKYLKATKKNLHK